ncbi:hypothetical protein LY622_11330 [Halomonas sp. M5N1S17]|uniref:hypothetical protein n=1 Tax=Halomonas alkalisoli TaxID=2907158 RepID=UPI001F2EC8F8|nr:hypothetical protein [Halomonas alkalisoli]MCE9664037.1 hypothetical protein [Halomonas alkalisoli]
MAHAALDLQLVDQAADLNGQPGKRLHLAQVGSLLVAIESTAGGHPDDGHQRQSKSQEEARLQGQPIKEAQHMPASPTMLRS